MLIISLHVAQLNEADMFIQCHEVKPKAEATASAVNAGRDIIKEVCQNAIDLFNSFSIVRV